MLIGKVASVYPHYCRLVLITDRACRVAVYSAKTGAVGISRGQNEPNLIVLDYVSHLQNLEINDLLISSGEGEMFPQGFGVGKLANFRQEGIYYRANLEILLDLTRLKYCYLINPNRA